MKKQSLSRSAFPFCQMAQKIAHSSGFWEGQRLRGDLLKKIERRFLQDDSALDEALNFLAEEMPQAHDILADLVEAAAEKPTHKAALKSLDCQLIAAPILAWSRYTLPSGELSPDFLRDFSAVFFQNIAASSVKHLVLGNLLFTPDNLPQNFKEMHDWSNRFAEKYIKNKSLLKYSIVDLNIQNEGSGEFLSDTRFVVGLMVAEKNAPFFVWEENLKITRDEVLLNWQKEAKKVLDGIFIGAYYEALLPSSFNASFRESDLKSRPYALNAAILFLKTSINILPEQMRLIVAYCFNKENEEYRISLAARNGHILYGVIWQILPGENDEDEVLLNIQKIAKEHRILDFTLLDERLPLEFCEDCGAPLFPNLSGDFLHPQMPQHVEENALN